ncbi:hypothetical protein ASPZODRAFT_1954346 [Penicilliopsis zonata CBS 506.65]|uniref:HSF-type DNA-binding domain-containing protein n=1 Tax=Penicilliopsis zonata CBS 506.65 TaxID=1073090 RepID=A0A1L9SGY2_9EURO|nr:hypothetical protein ASPZODRAFT_1954346 [Penicilliopsis zonata CBS 506.65]OJJ46357.1 hypothetical protein ASPZODRAFT_1954346 [Penicilliopsis zonata CBS 506.65]
MSSLAGPPPRNIITGGPGVPGKTQNLPVISSSSQTSRDPMAVTPPASAATGGAPPPVHSSPDSDRAGAHNANGTVEAGNLSSNTSIASSNNVSNPAVGAAAAAQQPKVVQTAFIHKLYNMLEDPSIQHLISWSRTNDSFVMSPTSEFSKVLAQYFKHTNISSFVRQLNMYGFHKVSDVFHTGAPDSALWEFKHGNGNFKRGDLIGLREIKRRASRHALIHRDSFPSHKPTVSQPGTPAESAPDAMDARMMNLENSLFDMHNRLARAEESNAALSSKYQLMADSLVRCYQWTHSISHFLQAMVPERESPLFRDVSNMQKEIEQHLDAVRSLDNSHEPVPPARQPFFTNVTVDTGPPLSPRQIPQSDSRRPSISVVDTSRSSMIRPPVPPHLAVSPRRYGSIGAANSSPNYNRPPVPPPVPPQQPIPHPLSTVSSPPGGPNLARRHTSADIRQHGWSPSGLSPFASANVPASNSAAPWPPSPHRTPTSSEQQVREVLAQYEMGVPRRFHDNSRHGTPPLATDTPPSTLSVEGGWAVGGPRFPRYESSLPATRRSSMASNVHSLLNPADTAERPNEDSPMGEDRKRRRLD